MNGSDGTKKAEELKRKARADRFFILLSLCYISLLLACLVFKKRSFLLSFISRRFGVPASSPSTDKSEEEAKKKARLARFGKDTKADTKVDSAEEDKRKARALRYLFMQPKLC